MLRVAKLNSIKIFAVIACLIFAMSTQVSGSVDFEPVFNPSIQTLKISESIKIDGKIDDSAWEKAGVASNFVERSPGDNTKPAVETEAYITYDNDYLYVAFKCYDDPASIRATMCERDQFHSDDAVIVLIDTYGNAAWAYEFFVNPYGVQKDQLWSSVSGEDSGYDMIWESAARITSEGYEVEIAIPFASMRFPNKDVQSWKVDLQRNRPRESYNQYSWSAYDRNEQCWPCQWGTIEGIKEVTPGKGIELMPTVITSQYGELRDPYDASSSIFDEHHVQRDASFWGKYSISSEVTLEGTVNPDFSQIEADAAQIDVNTTISLFFPERRPFFQEGRDIFRTLFNSFYTRTVNDPQYAFKLTSRSEKNRIGFLSAYDEVSPYTIPTEESTILFTNGKSIVNVFRGTQNIGGNNEIGILLSDRRYERGGSGSIIAFDHSFRLSNTYNLIGQYIFSHTKESYDLGETADLENYYYDDSSYTLGFDGESFVGNAFITQFRRNGRSWDFTINVDQVSPKYRTQTGFDPINNDRNFMFNTSYTFRPEKGLFERITPFFNTYNRWNFDGVKKMEYFNFDLNNNLRFAQSFLGLHYHFGKEMYREVLYDDLWGFGFDYFARFNGNITASFGFDLDKDISRGRRMVGNERSFYGGMTLKPIDRLIIEPEVNYARSMNPDDSDDKLFEQFITRSRFRLQINPRLSVRLVVQYVDEKYTFNSSDAEGNPVVGSGSGQYIDVDPLVTFKINPFSVFYIGTTNSYGDDNQIVPGRYEIRSDDMKLRTRQFFMKIQYLFQT